MNEIAALIAIANEAGQIIRVTRVNHCAIPVSSVWENIGDVYRQLAEAGEFIQSLTVDGEFVAVGEPAEETVLFANADDFACEYVLASNIRELIMINGDNVVTL